MTAEPTSDTSAPILERGRPVTTKELSWRADWIRLNTVRLIAQAGLGHYASTFSCAEISATLQIPVGSIGPQRARCLERLRKSSALADFSDFTWAEDDYHA